jgi:hypothetical protein
MIVGDGTFDVYPPEAATRAADRAWLTSRG